jgi:hypothetical protein
MTMVLRCVKKGLSSYLHIFTIIEVNAGVLIITISVAESTTIDGSRILGFVARLIERDN